MAGQDRGRRKRRRTQAIAGTGGGGGVADRGHGNAEQQAKGREALVEFRRKLYGILAEDDTPPHNGS